MVDSVETLTDWFVESFSFFQKSDPKLTLFLSIAVAFIYYYIASVARKPQLYCKAGTFRKVLEEIPALNDKFYPTPWCFGTHSQTLVSNVIRGFLPDVEYQRDLLDTPDGGVLALDWVPCELPDDAPISFFMAGLTGCSQTEYVKSMIPTASKLGCRVAVLNNRGRGGVDLKTARTYSALSYDDMDTAFRHIKSRYPNSIVLACGISLGGVILGHYLSDNSHEVLCDAALLVSSVYDCSQAVDSMELPGLNRMLNKHLARNLWHSVEPHKEKFKDEVDFDHVQQSTTIKEFDERFTSKVLGFKSVDDYYQAANLNNKIHQTRVPTLCICAADDMFQPKEALPLTIVEDNENLAFLVTARGGHIGFMEGFLPTLPFFSERLYGQYFGSMLENIRAGKFPRK